MGNRQSVADSGIVIPAIAHIHTAVYKAASKPNALYMHAWHTCETTHCRAGWVVALAAEKGKVLESVHGTKVAAQLIYKASGYTIDPARFYDNKADSLADMKRLAESETSA